MHRKYLQLALLIGAGMVSGAGAVHRAAPVPVCGGAPARLTPSADIYCMELIARPDVPGPTGIVELGRVVSPFDVSVTAEGRQRYDATLILAGLPAPGTLGPYTTYVAWIAPPSFDPMRKLGVVHNGRLPVGEIAFDKFLIFITAEANPEVTERGGKLVLRGMSPSIRMQQHSMLMVSSRAPDSMAMGHGEEGMHHHAGSLPEATWFMPPSRPGAPMMPMPGVDQLTPPVKPFLPGMGIDPATLPEAKPRAVVRLRTGDTLNLSASLVRRTINGRSLVMYAYNGQYPGPLIQVPEGATIVVRFHNAIDLPTAVHWHGVRLDNPNDGAVGVTQAAVEPGAGFTYKVHFRDAGVYWYHPHVREDIQQELGLYGNILVRPAQADAYGPVNREETLMLDDLLLGEEGIVPFGMDTPIHALMGRFGNLLLVNGDPRYHLTVAKGEVVRYNLTNVSNTRTFNLSFAGARMKLVGADIGRYERESWVESVAIAPAQRYQVDVRFPETGPVALMNQVQAIDHNIGNYFAEYDTLGMVTVGASAARPDHAASFATLRTNADVVRDVARYRPYFDRPPDKELFLTLKLGEIPFGVLQLLRRDQLYANPVEWSGTMPMMDWLTTGRQAEWVLRDAETGKENMAIDWHFKLGQIVKLRIGNDRLSLHPMSHPIHLHGQRFLVLAHNNVPNDDLVWKDTVLVPVGGTADILVDMANPGKWMVHCHIAEHLQAGMMGVFVVE